VCVCVCVCVYIYLMNVCVFVFRVRQTRIFHQRDKERMEREIVVLKKLESSPYINKFYTGWVSAAGNEVYITSCFRTGFACCFYYIVMVAFCFILFCFVLFCLC